MNKKLKQSRNSFDRLEKATEKEILKSYQGALKEVRGKLGEAYSKYDMEMFEMQKYNRLVGLEKQIEAVVNNLSDKNSGIINKHIEETYKDSYYRQAFYAESELKVNLAFPLVNKKVIEKVQNNNMSGLKWVERMGKNKDDTVYQIKQELSKGLIQGESYQKMSRRLKNRLDIDANKALTIARTEGGRARSEATYDALEHAADKGVELKRRWVSSVDDRTRLSHQMLDGEVVELDGTYSNGLRYPMDPMGMAEEVINCRCDEIAEFEGFEPIDRRIRDYGVAEYKTYNQWYDKKVVKKVADVVKVTKAYKDFESMGKHFEKEYNIKIDKDVYNLNYDLVASSMDGVEQMIKEYPNLANALKEVKVAKSGVMSTNGQNLHFNPNYYNKSHEELAKITQKQGELGNWVKNSNVESIAVHEMGHIINFDILTEEYGAGYLRTSDWNNDVTAKKIVSKACANVKRSQPSGEKQSYREIRLEQSKYGATNASEAIAEAYADQFVNGSNMSPVSKQIIKIIKEEYLKGK